MLAVCRSQFSNAEALVSQWRNKVIRSLHTYRAQSIRQQKSSGKATRWSTRRIIEF
jgi:hypothetical protein